MIRPCLVLLLAAAGCGPAGPARQAPAAAPIAADPPAPAPAPVAPDRWAARIARSLVPRLTGEGEVRALQLQDHERRALLVRGRDQADAIQGLLIDHRVELENPDSSGHLLRMATAIRLAAAGYTRARVERLEKMHVPIVAAAVANARRQASFDQLLILEPDIVVVEPLALASPADLGDGFVRSQRLRVVERLRGGFAPGTELSLRLTELEGGLEPGRRHLAMPSNGAYRHVALSRGDPPSLAPGVVILLAEAREIADERIAVPGEAARPFEELRTRISQLDSIDRELAPGLRPPSLRGNDGLWLIDTVDGEEIDPWRYWVRVAGGVPDGGHDDCNWWGREGANVISTEIGCRANPVRAAYQKALMGPRPPAAVIQPDGSLLVAASGYALVFRRPLD